VGFERIFDRYAVAYLFLFLVRIDETVGTLANRAGHTDDAHFVGFGIATGKGGRFE
jgi:hypothetical protein